jgi:hypothetical protein
MNTSQTISRFFHRPVKVNVRFPGASRKLVGFIEDDEDFDGFESEVKRMIELSGAVTPQYEAIALES